MKLRINLLLILFFALLSSGSQAQELTLPQLKGFKKSSDSPVFTSQNLWDYIDGAADTYLSYGFVDLHVAEYKKGKNTIKLEAYRHDNPVMAFGIYSTERSPSFKFRSLGSQGYTADGAINFFKGNYYIKIRTYSKNENVLKSAESLATQVAGLIPGPAEMPSALSLFPREGRKMNEETFINESVLGHKFLTKAFRADYESGSDSFSIFIINGTHEEIKNSVKEYLSASGTEDTDIETGRFMLKDGYNGTIFLAWNESRMVIISGLAKDQSDIADKYTSEILK